LIAPRKNNSLGVVQYGRKTEALGVGFTAQQLKKSSCHCQSGLDTDTVINGAWRGSKFRKVTV